MILAELVQIRGGRCQIVLLHPLVQNGFSPLLYLPVLAAQDGLYLSLGLGGRYKVNPRGLNVLRLGSQNFYLVATL